MRLINLLIFRNFTFTSLLKCDFVTLFMKTLKSVCSALLGHRKLVCRGRRNQSLPSNPVILVWPPFINRHYEVLTSVRFTMTKIRILLLDVDVQCTVQCLNSKVRCTRGEHSAFMNVTLCAVQFQDENANLILG